MRAYVVLSLSPTSIMLKGKNSYLTEVDTL